jgi:2-oxoglutarate dehydrogenase E1 component
VVLTPKSLLRHPEVVSNVSDLSEGGFREVLDDPERPQEPVHRVVLCSGKLYYDLAARRRSEKIRGVALIRVEQLYPFPGERLAEVAGRYPKVSECCWAQEEPKNMGAWDSVAPRLETLLGRSVAYVGRPEAASPATGFSFIHREEQESLVEEALGPLARGARRLRRRGGSRGAGRRSGKERSGGKRQ